MLHKYSPLPENYNFSNLKRSKAIIGSCLIVSFILVTTLLSKTSLSLEVDDFPPPTAKEIANQLLSILDGNVTQGFNFQPDIPDSHKKLSKIESQLNESFPYNASAPITRAIWQTWKVGLQNESFPQNQKPHIQTWIDKNPEYSYRLFPDAEMIDFIKQEFALVPSVLQAFQLMPKPVLKADFFRYLVVFAKGGIYTDIDTVNLQPVDSWMSSHSVVHNGTNNPGLIVGIEADPEMDDWRKYYARRIQFVQWTLQGKIGHPALRSLITHIIHITLDRNRNDLLNQVVGKDAGDDIMNWTGPGIWTDEIFRYLNELFQSPEYFADPSWDSYHQYLDWEAFTKLTKPVIIHDVAILPITSFAAGMGRMGAGNLDDPLAYVQHLFGGNWKNGKIDS